MSILEFSRYEFWVKVPIFIFSVRPIIIVKAITLIKDLSKLKIYSLTLTFFDIFYFAINLRISTVLNANYIC